MNPLAALAVIVGIVVVATALGLVWQARTGRVRRVARLAVTAADVDAPEAFGERATLLQFSTELCAPCRATRRVLGALATQHAGVVHIDVDLTDRPELAARFNILQTPTTLLLDSDGIVRGRIGGAPRQSELAERLRQITGETHVAAPHR